MVGQQLREKLSKVGCWSVRFSDLIHNRIRK